MSQKNLMSRAFLFRSWVTLFCTSMLFACGGTTQNDQADMTSSAMQISAGPPLMLGSSPLPSSAPKIAANAALVEQELAIRLATSSSSERADLGAEKAIDKNLNSRWSSGFSDQQWLMLDFGAVVNLTRLNILWENAHAESYQLQSSNDATNWVPFKIVTGSKGGNENLVGINATGRYLRLLGIKRSSAYGYSVFEIKAFTQSPPVDPNPPIDPVPGNNPNGSFIPTLVTASSIENSGLSAANATDGNLNTRWASAAGDDQWLQIDLGKIRDIGGMQLVWENAYATAYNIQISNDAKTWVTIRSVTDGKGGTEELIGIEAQGRFIRVQGVKRATVYGYSLFEVSVFPPSKTQVLDPNLPLAPSALNPAPNAQVIPLNGQAQAAIETIQRVEMDGTLVTLMGARSHERHSRERGESWFEADQMRGRYLPFPVKYFQYRTFGIEIRDNSRVKGVTKPRLEFWLHNPDADHQGTTFSFFRDANNPNVLDYGWAFNSGFSSNPNIDVSLCPKGQRVCSRIVDENWTTNPHSILKLGDKVELSPALRLPEPTPDGAGSRYYSAEWLYIVGEGLRPWYGVEPRLDSAPLPLDTLSGGLGSVSYNYSDEAFRLFQQMFNNIGMQNAQRFVEGRRLVHTSFLTGLHTEHSDENGTYLPAVGKVGNSFNQVTCVACHTMNGRSPAQQQFSKLDSMALLTGVTDATGKLHPHPLYGDNIQMNGSTGADGRRAVINKFETETRSLAGGEVITLQKPIVYFANVIPQNFSLRAAMPLIGVGLLEAVPEETILALADPQDKNGDGIRGIANVVFDGESDKPRLGRFGWKASKASLRQQTAAALLHDMGVTSPVYPRKSCQQTSVNCRIPELSGLGVSEEDITKMTNYLSLLAVPAQRSIRTQFPVGSVQMKEHDVDPVQILQGRNHFSKANCIACHVSELRTGKNHLFAELRDQVIHPYTDLLLHDMGEKLADSFPEAKAGPRHWRTPALWGIGLTAYVQGGEFNAHYLHDGRARNLTEAILWHGGEADKSRQVFEKMSAQERAALLAFLQSL
ncbi:MAG: discoidin domain-containing protein [Undibacterium sp.]|nr:discoidin domain-containing protein [Undibacterium sp.]